jgi:eukaryotic-like serine/threonine-protein kinase
MRSTPPTVSSCGTTPAPTATSYALDRATGREVWSKDMGATVAGTPTLVEDVLYVGTFGNALYALEAASGEDVWPAFKTANWVWDGPAVLGNVLYFTDVSGNVYAVNAASGQQAWAPQKPGAAMRARPAITPERLFTGDRSGNLFALNPDSGGLAWQTPVKVDGQILATPVIVGDYVVVAPYQGDNALESYTLDGSLYWPFKPGN